MSKHRGYEIEIIGDKCTVTDSRLQPLESWDDLPCGHCNKMDTPEGHDACLGTLPGVMNACCGHGDPSSAYLQFNRHFTLRGFDALRRIDQIKNKSSKKWYDSKTKELLLIRGEMSDRIIERSLGYFDKKLLFSMYFFGPDLTDLIELESSLKEFKPTL